MKILKTSALCLLMGICSLSINAQEGLPFNEPGHNKPKLFADLPNKFHFDVASFEKLLNLTEGAKVNVHLTGSLNFHGVVVSRSNPGDTSIRSVAVKSINRQGAHLTFTRSQNTDGTFAYVGRIVSRDHSDALQIQLEEGQYVLVKTDLYDLMNE